MRYYNARDINKENNNNDANADKGKVDHDFVPHVIKIGQLNEVLSYRPSENSIGFATNMNPDCDYSSDNDDSVNKTGATTDTGNESQL